MILIFGGTTEGRMAATTLDEAGSPFYYSTLGGEQAIALHHGQHMSGAMTLDHIRRFCHDHDIRLIVDAAHPFATHIHATIAQVGLPVVRLERPHTDDIPGAIYCDNFADAITRLRALRPRHLLALTGVKTIAKLRDWWTANPTTFRILNRPSSIAQAQAQGLPADQIIYYNDSLQLPDTEQEIALMQTLGIDAVITKDSGNEGGLQQKAAAAQRLNIPLIIVRRPINNAECRMQNAEFIGNAECRMQNAELRGNAELFPFGFGDTAQPNSAFCIPHSALTSTVHGRWSLRRAIEHLLPQFFPLHTGFTTGSCALAATKAALLTLLGEDCPAHLPFALPDGEQMQMPVTIVSPGKAFTIKDFSDDPDVTRGCKIIAEVNFQPQASAEATSQNNPTPSPHPQVHFTAGEGVGHVTLPGLGLEVGQAAINPVPRQMIADMVSTYTDQPVDITLSIENGKELARRTFNSRVGVEGGLSILGTLGIVRPLSNEAFEESLRREIHVAHATGCQHLGLVAGMRSEQALLQQDPTVSRCVHYGNSIGEAIRAAAAEGIPHITLAIMLGKAVKLAEGHLNTHSHTTTMNKSFLHTLATEARCTPAAHQAIDTITLANQLWQLLPPSDLPPFLQTLEHHILQVLEHTITSSLPQNSKSQQPHNLTLRIVKS